MNKLHPRAVWSFFFQYLLLSFFCLFMIALTFVAPIISAILKNTFFTFLPGFLVISFLIIWISLSYIFAKLSYKYWKYQLAETSIRIEKGVIWKKYISIPYNRIQNVDIYRGIIARLLGLSDVHIQTAGYSGQRRPGFASEGRLPGLDIPVAEQLRDDLISKIKGPSQGI